MVIIIGMRDSTENSLRICTLQVPSTTSLNTWSSQLQTSSMCVSSRQKSTLKSTNRMNTNVELLIREVLDSRNSIVKIDANDVNDLFHKEVKFILMMLL